MERFLPHLDAVISGQVEQGVLEHASVSGGEDEPVAVEPVGILGVVTHHLVVEDVAHRGAPHGKPWMPRVRLLDRIDREEPDGVDGLIH